MNEKDRFENMSPANCCIEQTLADRNMSVALEYENHQFIMLVQAMVGGLHPHIAAMGMRCVDEVVQLHVVVDEKTDAVLAAVRDIESGWRALQSTDVPCECRVLTGGPGALYCDGQLRPLYVRYVTGE